LAPPFLEKGIPDARPALTPSCATALTPGMVRCRHDLPVPVNWHIPCFMPVTKIIACMQPADEFQQ
jgi:hypothetical protein